MKIDFYDYYTEAGIISNIANARKNIEDLANKPIHSAVSPSDFHYFKEIDETVYDNLSSGLTGNAGKDKWSKNKVIDETYEAKMSGFGTWLKRQIRKKDGSKEADKVVDDLVSGKDIKEPNVSAIDKPEVSATEKPAELSATQPQEPSKDTVVADVSATSDSSTTDDTSAVKTADTSATEKPAELSATQAPSQAPSTSATEKPVETSASDEASPVKRTTGRLSGTIVTIPVKKIVADDKPYLDKYVKGNGDNISVDVKDIGIPSYVRKLAIQYLSKENINSLSKTLKAEPVNPDAQGAEAPTTLADSLDFFDEYVELNEAAPWTNKAKLDKLQKKTDVITNKEKAAQTITDMEGGKVSAVRVFRVIPSGKIYLLTMIDKESKEHYYVAANSNALKNFEKKTKLNFKTAVESNKGALGKEFGASASSTATGETVIAYIPSSNKGKINADQFIARSMDLGSDWEKYVVPFEEETLGKGFRYGNKQSGYLYIFKAIPNKQDIGVVTANPKLFKAVISDGDEKKYVNKDGVPTTQKFRLVAVAQPEETDKEKNPDVSAEQKPVSSAEAKPETSATATVTTSAETKPVESSATEKPATTSAEAKPETSATVTTSAQDKSVDTSASDKVQTSAEAKQPKIDWTKYDILFGNGVIYLSRDALSMIEEWKKLKATGKKFIADDILGDKKQKEYIEKPTNFGGGSFYKFPMSDQHLGSGDAQDPSPYFEEQGYAFDDLSYKVKSGDTKYMRGYYKKGKTESFISFKDFKQRMLNELENK